MSAKIIDEFTDRKDLNPYQKWLLRHPGARNAHDVKYVQSKLEKDPCYYDAANKRHYAKKKLAKIKEKHKHRGLILNGRNNVSLGKRAEIINLHNKGKELSSICIWTNSPMSLVSSVLQQWKDSQK